ncbi:unnamed protein product, partial [Urochloa humidicola]
PRTAPARIRRWRPLEKLLLLDRRPGGPRPRACVTCWTRRHHHLLRKEDENLWNEGLDWNAGIHMQSENEEEQDMDIDPDIMNDADEL